MQVPFNVPYTSSESAINLKYLVENPTSLGSGKFKGKCISYFERIYPEYRALLTPSCTRSMELIALSLEICHGDEVIMPSYCYVGVANAFANMGATLVFADVLKGNMNIDPDSIERCITSKTRAVIIMHYSGVACNTKRIRQICDDHGVILIEDAAQAIGCSDNTVPLGSLGDFTCISFDPLKNISCGEGGLLLCKKQYWQKVLSAFDNGTNRHAFELGKIETYEWVGFGSKFEMSEYTAAILYPLLHESDNVMAVRISIWRALYDKLVSIGFSDETLPTSFDISPHNGHLFYIKCANTNVRIKLIKHMKNAGIACASHFSPLHSSPRARAQRWVMDQDIHTTVESTRLLRLPMHNYLTNDDLEHISKTMATFRSL